MKILFALALIFIPMKSSFASCQTTSIDVMGDLREILYCPPEKESLQAIPLVIAFHGRGSTAQELADSTRLHELWPEALTVYPVGLAGNPAPHDPKGLRKGWQIHVNDLHGRDILFTDAILDLASKHYKVDHKRIFAVGHSNGARFVGILWSERADRFAAFAFSAAQANELISSSQARSVVMSMGMMDDVVSFKWQQNSILQASKLLSISDPVKVDVTGPHIYQGDRGLKLATFIHEGGHIWPKGLSEFIIDFFKGQSLN